MQSAIETFKGIVDDYLFDKGYKYEWTEDISSDDKKQVVYVSIVYQEDGEQYTEQEEISYDEAIEYVEKQIGVKKTKSMQTEDVMNILKDRGYKVEPAQKMPGIPASVEQFAYKRIAGSDCQTNERPPNIVVVVSSITYNDTVHTSMSVYIKGETISGRWCDLSQYGLSLDEIEHISDIEYELTKCWEILN